MRIRSIKPEFWRSDDVAALPLSARLLFIGLWSYVDDNGVGSDKVSSIAADLFAPDLEVDPTETFRRVSVDSASLENRGLIVRYEVAGKPLLYITKWESHQLVKNPSLGHKYPLPPGELVAAALTLPRPSGDSTETLGTGTGEQGNRGTGEQGNGGEGTGEQNSSSEVAIATTRPDVDYLCNLLADLIAENGSKRPTPGKGWHDSARLLIDKDGRTLEQVEAAIRWSQANAFWKSNILSMPKLREKYDTLRLQAQREQQDTESPEQPKRRQFGPTPEERAAAVIALGMEGEHE